MLGTDRLIGLAWAFPVWSAALDADEFVRKLLRNS